VGAIGRARLQGWKLTVEAGGGEVADGDCAVVLDEGVKISMADDDEGVVLQHRGREDEVWCTTNRIHGAWRSGSSRRGGFGGSDFKNGDNGGRAWTRGQGEASGVA
jgi:hypothetical protein